jgi:S1-C subfamily serine protease
MKKLIAQPIYWVNIAGRSLSAFTKNLFVVLLWCLSFAGLGYAAPEHPEPKPELKPEQQFEQRVQQGIERALGSVVTVEVQTQSGPRYGSAFIVDKTRGLLLTNYHVVAPAHRILIHGEAMQGRLPVELVYFETKTDLALLRAKNVERLPAALALGSSDTLHRGQFVIALGSPGGLEQSSTLGIVSALNRKLPDYDRDIAFIQIDAPVYQGSSGGPICNLDGAVVGILTRRAAHGAAAFAIPSSAVKSFMENFELKSKNGTVAFRRVGYLGAEIQPLSAALAEILQYRGPGVLVAGVYPGSAAKVAGLTVGNLIIAVDKTELRASQPDDMTAIESVLAAAGPGTHHLEIRRNAQLMTVPVEFRDHPACNSARIESKQIAATLHANAPCYWFPEGPFHEITSNAAFGKDADDAPKAGDLMIEIVGGGSLSEVLTEDTSSTNHRLPRIARVLRAGRPRLVALNLR